MNKEAIELLENAKQMLSNGDLYRNKALYTPGKLAIILDQALAILKEQPEPKCKTCGGSGVKKPDEGCGECLSIDGNCRADCPCPDCKEQPNCEGCEFFKHTHSNEHCYRYTEARSLCKLRQEPGEFFPLTCKDMYKVIQGCCGLCPWCVGVLGRYVKQESTRLDSSEAGERILEERIEKLSDTLDRSEAENKALRRPLEAANFKVDGMLAVGNELTKQNKQIKALEASRKELLTACVEYSKGVMLLRESNIEIMLGAALQLKKADDLGIAAIKSNKGD